MSKSISVSLLGDKAYRDALSAVAKRHKKDAGALVREALDQCFGDEISEALSFFNPDVESVHQSVNESGGVKTHV